MNDLRKAAEMALKQLQRDDWYLGHRSKTRADAIIALQQALDDEPPVKTYCGGKPNYCTPEVTPEVTPYVDAVNMTQDRVDETAKGEHEWVGLTDEEIKDIIFADNTEFGLKTYSASDWAKIKRTENLLREKNVPQP